MFKPVAHAFPRGNLLKGYGMANDLLAPERKGRAGKSGA